MADKPSVHYEKAKLKVENGEMSVAYAIPSVFADDLTCLIIAPGAGGPMYSPFISYFHTELAKKGLLTIKFNFPYMEAGRKFPDKPEVLKSSYRRIVQEAKGGKYRPSKIFIGGKSMGGRIGSMIVAEGEDVNGLFFLGYPLHPPGRMESLRDEHLYRITKPMLFISGTRDTFAKRELLEKVTRKLGSSTQVHWVEGGDHSLNAGNGKEALTRTYEEVVDVLAEWVSSAHA